MSPSSVLICALLFTNQAPDAKDTHFEPMDVFELEVAANPQLSPSGEVLVYERRFMDVMADRQRSNLWTLNVDGSEHRPLTTGNQNDGAPLWSPDGTRLLYRSSTDGSSQLYVRWMDTGQTAKVTNLTSGPSAASWSPNGEWVAFTAFVEAESESFGDLPTKPEGATWAPAAKVITQLNYRSDGAGYLTEGFEQLFVVPAEGGTARQLTSGAFDVSGPAAWSHDGTQLFVSSNRRSDADLEPVDSELYRVALDDGELTALTERYGPDQHPLVSPDGRLIAYLGHDDTLLGYQPNALQVMGVDGQAPRNLTAALDRNIDTMQWAKDGSGLFVSFADQGETKLAFVPLSGDLEVRASGVGGTSLGRPYSSGSFTVGPRGVLVFTKTTPARPSDLAILRPGDKASTQLTHLNEDLLLHKQLGKVTELRFKCSRPVRQAKLAPSNQMKGADHVNRRHGM